MSLVTVRLHGDLRKFLPEPTKFSVGSTREAIRALETQNKAFRAYIIDRSLKGANYHVVINESESISEEQLQDPLAECTIDIIPAFEGSGSVFKIIAGVALIGLGIATGGIGFLSANTLILVGASLALSGFVGLMQPPQNDSESDENKKSFIFNGAENISAINQRVPVVLGRGFKGQGLLVGSIVVEANIKSYIQEEEDEDG